MPHSGYLSVAKRIEGLNIAVMPRSGYLFVAKKNGQKKREPFAKLPFP